MKYAYQLRDIKHVYHKILALSLPELNIQAQKITALIGANGCGKSTLLNLLAFLLKNQHGQIKCAANMTTKRIALLPQKPYMLRGSVFDNLNVTLQFHGIKKSARSALIDDTLAQLNMTEFMYQSAKTLSGGELQKVALARAIITHPDILLLDEPFNYLDYGSVQALEKFIHTYVKQQHNTLIFSTHNRLQGVAIADNVISLVKGKLVKTPLLNVFHGQCNKQLFNTQHIQILLADSDKNYQHIAIDPHQIVLSKKPIKSSMRNQYQGKVLAITDEAKQIRVTVVAGELFQVLVTYQALKNLQLSLGDKLWVNFKTSAIVAF